jgi:hypothetical protein
MGNAMLTGRYRDWKRCGRLSAMVLLAACALAVSAQDFERERAEMVRSVERMADEAGRITGRRVLAGDVLAALGRVPRHELVP